MFFSAFLAFCPLMTNIRVILPPSQNHVQTVANGVDRA